MALLFGSLPALPVPVLCALCEVFEEQNIMRVLLAGRPLLLVAQWQCQRDAGWNESIVFLKLKYEVFM